MDHFHLTQDNYQWPQDTFQWPPQGGYRLVTAKVESCTRPISENYRKLTAGPQEDHHQPAAPADVVNCPRCKSNNTKFCYYNNYSISQPRYLCKSCKRYWTEGGHVRDVPVGGGARKHRIRRPTSSSSSSSSSSVKKMVSINLDLPKMITPEQNPRTRTLCFDFNPTMNDNDSSSYQLSFENNLDPHRNATSSSSCHVPVESLVAMPVSDSNSVFSSDDIYMHGVEPCASFSMLDHHHGVEDGYGNNLQAVQENTATSSSRIVFAFEELGEVISASDHRFDDYSYPNGCWDNGDYGVMDDRLW